MFMNCILPGVPSRTALWSSELYTKNELSDFLATEIEYCFIDIIQFAVTTVLFKEPQFNINFPTLNQSINHNIFKTNTNITYKQKINVLLIFCGNITSDTGPIFGIITAQNNRCWMIRPVIGFPFECSRTIVYNGHQEHTE